MGLQTLHSFYIEHATQIQSFWGSSSFLVTEINLAITWCPFASYPFTSCCPSEKCYLNNRTPICTDGTISTRRRNYLSEIQIWYYNKDIWYKYDSWIGYSYYLFHFHLVEIHVHAVTNYNSLLFLFQLPTLEKMLAYLTNISVLQSK